MTFSTFTAYFAANSRNVPAAVRAEVRRAAIARVTERQQAGRADSALDFADLIATMEKSIAGA